MEDKAQLKEVRKEAMTPDSSSVVLWAGVTLVYDASRSSKPKFCAAEGM